LLIVAGPGGDAAAEVDLKWTIGWGHSAPGTTFGSVLLLLAGPSDSLLEVSLRMMAQGARERLRARRWLDTLERSAGMAMAI